MQQWSWTASMGGVLHTARMVGQRRGPGTSKTGRTGHSGWSWRWCGCEARFIAPPHERSNLSPQPFVVNKSGGAGAEGFLYVKGKHADPASLSSPCQTFTTLWPLGHRSLGDLTPLARLALG